MKTLMKPLAVLVLSATMLASAQAAPVIPAKYHGEWCRALKDPSHMFYMRSKIESYRKKHPDYPPCDEGGSIVKVTATQLTGWNECNPEYPSCANITATQLTGCRPVAILTKTDAGDDPENRYHVITFRCEQATVAYELSILDGDKYPTSTLKSGKALFIDETIVPAICPQPTAKNDKDICQ